MFEIHEAIERELIERELMESPIEIERFSSCVKHEINSKQLND
jgi:hypothetical protein